MAQRIVDNEQYEAVLIKGGLDSGSVPVDGKAYRSVASFARPNNASGYTAGDVVGSADSAIHTLSGVGPSGGFAFVQSISMTINASAVPAGMAAFRVHLYSSSPAAIADNAVFGLASGEASAYMGYIDLSAPQDLGSVLYTQADYPGRLVKLASGSTSLFAEIETRGAYTPASGTIYGLRVNTIGIASN